MRMPSPELLPKTIEGFLEGDGDGEGAKSWPCVGLMAFSSALKQCMASDTIFEDVRVTGRLRRSELPGARPQCSAGSQ
jgi:hypothetical protein